MRAAKAVVHKGLAQLCGLVLSRGLPQPEHALTEKSHGHHHRDQQRPRPQSQATVERVTKEHRNAQPQPMKAINTTPGTTRHSATSPNRFRLSTSPKSRTRWSTASRASQGRRLALAPTPYKTKSLATMPA